MNGEPLVIIGAGPAGLTAAYEAISIGMKPIVLEKGDMVGGIARTETYSGYYFDVGGHRFFTKIKEVDELWREVLGEDFIKVQRMSRIYYKGRFYHYPLRAGNALFNTGILESVRITASYLYSQFRPCPEETTFEHWVSNRFGKRLYHIFYKTYTEKVWGIPCSQIRADWAAQRIKGLSLTSALYNAFFSVQKARTLVDEFDYPMNGPGMMWGRFQEMIVAGGGQIRLKSKTTGLRHENRRITHTVYQENGETKEIPMENLISSAPITSLVAMLDPKAPAEVLDAVSRLTYRAFIIVVLIIKRKALFPDQWIYINDPNTKVGRIQNFKNWSKAMVPDPETTSLGMEYFCNEGDEIWNMIDADLMAIASRELSVLGLADSDDIVDSCVLRQSKAYPVYDYGYNKQLDVIRKYLETFKNLQTIGRNGMHRYNNMDHSMFTGLMAVQNISGSDHNLWTVNEDEAYIEEAQNEENLKRLIPETMLIRTFSRMDKLSFAIALGTVSGLIFFIATLLAIRGGDLQSPNLSFLAEYFKGYSISIKGACIAFIYTFIWGFLFGWLFAYLRNLFLAIYLFKAKKRAELMSLRDFLNTL